MARSQQPAAGRADPRQDCPWTDLPADGSTLTIEAFVTFALARLGDAGQRNITARYLAAFDLKLTEWRLLAALAEFSPAPFGQLVSVSSSDKALVSRTLRTLVDNGMARTERDPANPKKLIASITDSGRRLYQRVMPVAQRAQAEVLLQLNEADRVALYHLLRKLQDAMDLSRAS